MMNIISFPLTQGIQKIKPQNRSLSQFLRKLWKLNPFCIWLESIFNEFIGGFYFIKPY